MLLNQRLAQRSAFLTSPPDDSDDTKFEDFSQRHGELMAVQTYSPSFPFQETTTHPSLHLGEHCGGGMERNGGNLVTLRQETLFALAGLSGFGAKIQSILMIDCI